ncbi:post-GPI attachment to proteins factor 2-like isoform 1-T2 [Menidia menidia]
MLQGPLGPPYGAVDRDRPLLRLPFPRLAVATVLLPLTALLLCLGLALRYHRQEATYTHCQVSNFLPSISAAISLVPERYVWRGCVGMHSAPRLLVAAAYFRFYALRFRRRRAERLLAAITLLCSLAENAGLLLLTYVASTETYSLHKNGFVLFIASSLLHMLSTCWLWRLISRNGDSPEEVSSYRWKLRLFLFNIGCCAAAAYFYRRHNKYCEPGVYTLFAGCEYLVVFSNMAFHMTAFWDFSSQEVRVGPPPEDKRF